MYVNMFVSIFMLMFMAMDRYLAVIRNSVLSPLGKYRNSPCFISFVSNEFAIFINAKPL